MGFINNKKPNTLFRIGGGAIPTGTININSNGIHSVAGYANADVNVPQPSGTKTITSNGIHDVFWYANVDVNVPQPSGTKNITANGDYNVASFETAHVDVPQGVTPIGTKSITENGLFDVAQFANADVNVPTGVTPTGTKTITDNGIFDVANFANADVQLPLGTKSITANGTYNASDVFLKGFSSVDVNVPQGVFPTGTKLLTTNGTYDISTFEKVRVAVPVPSGIKGIYENGDYDVTNYATAHVNLWQGSSFPSMSLHPKQEYSNEIVVSISKDGNGNLIYPFCYIADQDLSSTSESGVTAFWQGFIDFKNLRGMYQYYNGNSINTGTFTVTLSGSYSTENDYSIRVSSNLFIPNHYYAVFRYNGYDLG